MLKTTLAVKTSNASPGSSGGGSVGTDSAQQSATSAVDDQKARTASMASSGASGSGGSKATDDVSTMLSAEDRARQEKESVLASLARALGELSKFHPTNQSAIVACGGIPPLISVLTKAAAEGPRVAAAGVLWSLSVGGHSSNQDAIAAAGGINALVSWLGADGGSTAAQSQAAKALAALAEGNASNTFGIATRLVSLLQRSAEKNEEPAKERAARALSNFCAAGQREAQDAVMKAGGIELLVSLLRPHIYKPPPPSALGASATSKDDGKSPGGKGSKAAGAAAGGAGAAKPSADTATGQGKEGGGAEGGGEGGTGEEELEDVETAEAAAMRQAAQKELAGAIWHVAFDNAAIQRAVAEARAREGSTAVAPEQVARTQTTQPVEEDDDKAATPSETTAMAEALVSDHDSRDDDGVNLLIRMLADHPDVHRDVGGALWALAQLPINQQKIVNAGGIAPLVALLKTGKKNNAQETAAGALHALASALENRAAIADAGGIDLLIPILEGGSLEAKAEVTGALVTLATDNISNQFTVVAKLTALLSAGPDDAKEATKDKSPVSIAKVEACEYATRVLYTLSLEPDNREPLSSAGSITQLVRQLKGGSETAQTLAAEALIQIARMGPELRVQVVQQLVALLSSESNDVRQRSGNTLREMSVNKQGSEDPAHQRAAAAAGGVGPLVQLLRSGLEDGRVEAQEYSLWSLSCTSTGDRAQTMVEAGCIPCLVQALTGGQLSAQAQAHAATVLAFLAVDSANHAEIVQYKGIQPCVSLLRNGTLPAKKHSAIALARLANGDAAYQTLIFDAGAVPPLVSWLGQPSLGPPEVAASALSHLAKDNADMQQKITNAEAVAPLVAMLALEYGGMGDGGASFSFKKKSTNEIEGQKAAGDCLAILASDNPQCQALIAAAGGIPPLVTLLQYGRPQTHTDAAHALAMLASDEENKMQIARAGGIGPLVKLLSTGDAKAQEYGAKALECLARDCVENQVTLAQEKASQPLVALLGSDSLETAESAVSAVSCGTETPDLVRSVVYHSKAPSGEV